MAAHVQASRCFMRNLQAFALLIALMTCAALYAKEAPELSGPELFLHFCASCHGTSAHGDGPVASSLKINVPDLTRIAVRNGGTFPADRVRNVIDGQDVRAAHGTREMPVWGWEWYGYQGEDAGRRKYVAERVEKLVKYLGSLQRQ